MRSLKSFALEAFVEYQEKYLDEKYPPLGKLAVDLTIRVLQLDNPVSDRPISGHFYIPLLYAHGYIINLYNPIQKEAFRIDSESQGDWPLFLRTISIPLDDRVYYERNNSFTSQAMVTLEKLLTERLQFFTGVSPNSGLPARINDTLERLGLDHYKL
jgi:hypothetical protein